MKKLIITLCVFIAFETACSNAQLFDKLKKDASKLVSGKSGLSEADAANGIKEALIQGTNKSTDLVSKVDGYYKNPEIMIPFPTEAKKVESTLRKAGLGSQVDKAVVSLNRAAEDAAKSATPIFVAAVKEMTVNDAIGIVKGDNTSATKYLKVKTTNKLTDSFRPVIKNSLDKVDATKHWSDVMNAYNKIPFVEKINPDLTQYVTEKALEGLFLMISKEEVNIRQDPMARTTDLLKKVFGK